MVILSLFDGISCGKVALDRLENKVSKYYSSEIDKYCLRISKKNHPDIIQLGDICNWESWDIETPDLIIGGSPCQGFSYAGKRLNFYDKRSILFFKFIDILKHYKPRYWLFENVKMKKEWQDIITSQLNVEPVELNSDLVSGQNRKRLYWFNWDIEPLKDKSILSKSILQKSVVYKEKTYYLDKSFYLNSNDKQLHLNKNQLIKTLMKNESILHNLYKGFNESFPRIFNTKSPTIRTSSGGGHIPSVFLDWYFENDYIVLKHRLLTPVECERLQTLPDNYTECEGVSNTQRYKMLGNGWTVDVIVHILKHINDVKGVIS